MTDYPIPKRASLDDIKDILKAYYLEGAHSEPVSTNAVENAANMSDKVGRQTKFLVGIGLLKKEGRSGRILTEDGEDIAEALMAGNETLAKSLMSDTLSEWEFTSKITGFLRMQRPEPVESDRLLEYISANSSSSDKRGRKTLINLLEWCQIIKNTEDGYELSKRGGEEDSDEVKESEDTNSKTDRSTEVETATEETATAYTPNVTEASVEESTANVNIQIEISGSDDPANVEQVITAVKNALDPDSDGE
ncbi:hypothetical protein [Salarchaeum japonicum]|uniref:hypothetical protein n=1 Tax=Salarchaeum japonicum TaxID=555573 RepID=UPI003C733845